MKNQNKMEMKRIFLSLFFIFILSINGNSQWVRVGSGPLSNLIFTLAVSPNSASGATLFAGTDWQSYKTTDNGTTWIQVGGVPGGIVLEFFVHGSYVFAGPSGFSPPGIFRSSDNGVSWTSINNGFPDTNDQGMVFAASGSNLFVGTFQSGIFLSTNNGDNWTAVNNGFPINKQVASLQFSGPNLFASVFGSGVLLTTNNGENWNAINNGLPDLDIYSLAAAGESVYAAGSFGICRTTNNGKNWTLVNNGLPGGWNAGIGSIMSYGNSLFAGGASKVYLSTNSGLNWISVSNGLPTIYSGILDLVVCPDGTGGMNLFAATNSYGLWRRPLSEIISVQNLSTEVPSNFELRQNYPNPFNPTTNIKFDIPMKSFVKLVIYDLLGKEVATLVNEELTAGSYQADWNASEYPSGVYFYRIQTDDFVQTRSMVLVK